MFKKLIPAFLLFVPVLDGLNGQIDGGLRGSSALRSEVIARNGMVATSHPLATQIGLDILKAGGSAVDAAIAANAALGLMEPTGSGIGGDLFAIVWSQKDGRLYGLNASGRAPLGLGLEELRAELARLGTATIPKNGLLPITVPGTVDGWFELHSRFGRLPMDRVLAPAIGYADEGFPVTEVIARSWRQAEGFKNLPGAAYVTWAPGGVAPKKGDIFRNPDLAATYRALATGGRDAFYKGAIADRIDAFMRANGGWLRKVDFEKHTSTWVDPVSVNYRGYDIYEIPPNSQGIAALQMLNILEGFDLRAMGRNSADALHVMIEAKKLAFEDRAKFYADPEFAEIPLKGLLSKEYAATRRALIDLNHAGRDYDAGNPALHHGDTIYLCTADAEGNMVSLIQSNSGGMGCGIMVPGTGFGFQNRGQMYVLEPSHANCYAPGKRPFHTIIPAFVMKDSRPLIAFGVMGGEMQPQGHVQIIANLVDFGLNLQEAGDVPRWRHEGSTDFNVPEMTDGGWVNFEPGIPSEAAGDLAGRGHDVRWTSSGFGGYQAIMRDHERGIWIGASESRKDGHAAGW